MARRPNDRPDRPLGKRLFASLLAATLATTPLVSHPADLNAEMQAMFNDLGALGNVATPGAFRGQAMNLYTGGSLMMRAPGRNYPLATVQLPACGPAVAASTSMAARSPSSTSSNSSRCCRTSAPTPWAMPSSSRCSRSRPTSTSC
jgi:hypothetical protein